MGSHFARGSLVGAGAFLALAAACKDSSSPTACADCDLRPAPSVCNGRTELCARAYDAVAFPGTHDAYSNVAQRFVAPDQSYPVARQLDDGVRVLHLEIKTFQDDAYLCHGPCEFGSTLLVEVLTAVSSFTASRPDEVVTLLMESNDVTTDLIGAAAAKSGILPALHVQSRGDGWPTLGAMIQSRKRVVVFNADFTMTGGASYPWLHDRFAWTWETPWDNASPQDFSRCAADRGTMDNGLYVVDTYREDQLIPTLAQAVPVNTNPFLLQRILRCQKTTGRLPNFVMVNYYEVGDLFHDVDVLNGFAVALDADAASFPPITSWSDGGGAANDAQR